MITKIGNYELNNTVEKTTGLKEYTDDEYALFSFAGHSRILSDEKIYHGDPVEFVGCSWTVIIGANKGKIFNIGLLAADYDTQNIEEIFKSTLKYLVASVGKYHAHPIMSKKYTWNMGAGSIGLDMQKKLGRKAVTVFLTSVGIADEMVSYLARNNK